MVPGYGFKDSAMADLLSQGLIYHLLANNFILV